MLNFECFQLILWIIVNLVTTKPFGGQVPPHPTFAMSVDKHWPHANKNQTGFVVFHLPAEGKHVCTVSLAVIEAEELGLFLPI